jgi:hypothetical protein
LSSRSPATSNTTSGWSGAKRIRHTLENAQTSLRASTVMILSRSAVICARWWRMLFCILNLKAVLFPHREYDRCRRSHEVLGRTASVA